MSDDPQNPECARPRAQQPPQTDAPAPSPAALFPTDPTHPSQLIDSHLDDSLTPDDQLRLEQWLSADPNNLREFIRQTHLHHSLRQHARASFSLPASGSEPRPGILKFPRQAPVLALAAALTLIATLLVWYFTARSGSPMIAQINGTATIERSEQFFPARPGFALLPGDLIHTGATGTVTITFAPEKTDLTIEPSTDLRLLDAGQGKAFFLRTGKMEASVARQRPFKPLRVRTQGSEARVLGTKFTLNVTNDLTRLAVSQGSVLFTPAHSSTGVIVRVNQYAEIGKDRILAVLPATGVIRYDAWTNVSWKHPAEALLDERFPTRPVSHGQLAQFEVPILSTNHFAFRVWGYLQPPLNGDYEFWLAGAQRAQLYLSPSDRPAQKQMIAALTDATEPRQWDLPRAPGNGSVQRSGPIHLEAGRRYFIEAIVVAPDGQAHLSVAWKRPNAPREVLPAQFISDK